jgi:hypothetical protein
MEQGPPISQNIGRNSHCSVQFREHPSSGTYKQSVFWSDNAALVHLMVTSTDETHSSVYTLDMSGRHQYGFFSKVPQR